MRQAGLAPFPTQPARSPVPTARSMGQTAQDQRPLFHEQDRGRRLASERLAGKGLQAGLAQSGMRGGQAEVSFPWRPNAVWIA